MMEMTRKATREGFGEEILALGKQNQDIYVVDADIANLQLSVRRILNSTLMSGLRSRMQLVLQRDWRRPVRLLLL